MHIEPLNRPHVWQPLRLEALESEDGNTSEDENGG
jgi:hypothetical protein